MAYNRFRYYDPEQGNYISKDPIGLDGENHTLYGYVKDINTWIDPYGLKRCKSERVQALPEHLQRRPKWTKANKEHLKKNSLKDAKGRYIDVKTGKPIPKGKEAIGHQGETWREYQDNPVNHTKTREQVIDDYNNIDNLGYENSSSNSSNGAKTKGLEN